jgi:hypothetical protein
LSNEVDDLLCLPELERLAMAEYFENGGWFLVFFKEFLVDLHDEGGMGGFW